MQEMQKTQVQSLGQEAPLEEEMATTPVFLPGKSHGQGSLAGYSPWGRKESDTTKHTHSILDKYNLSGSLFVDWFPMFSASLVAQLVKNPPVMQETWV